ncbi:MAG: hypothetical protein KJO28_14175 [Desulfofustis sp.]|nr:hypothetical protein [Desulfofustis sp.]NNF47826.1 hypothetical protein [Desulfofustis sp.]NNK56424.1 hypothetical protein [Desulfofustis sp.]
MSNNQSVRNIWSITEDSEKKRVIKQFIQKHGEHYTEEDLIKYLTKKYKITHFNPSFASVTRKEH